MATTTASLTITSSDLVGDALSLSATNNLYKAGTTTGLDQITGLTKTYLTAVTPIDLFGAIIDSGEAPPAASSFEGKSHWIYISNKSEDEAEYATITIGDKVIGRLWAGDFLWMPWDQAGDTDTGNKHADIELAPSVATGMWFEHCMIHEGMQLPTSV